MEQQAAMIIGALILTGVLWVAKISVDNRTSLAVLTVTIQGLAKALDITVTPQIASLRAANHARRDEIQALTSQHELLVQRVEVVESWNGEERRSGEERRHNAS